MNDYYSEFSRKKKINMVPPFFYSFLILVLVIIIASTIGFILDITVNLKLQVVNRFGAGKDSVEYYLQWVRTTQIIKFITIVLFSLVFCVSIWFGIRRIAYGYIFTITFIIIFALLLSGPYILGFTPLWYEIIQMISSAFIILCLLVFGFRQRYHRAILKEKLLAKKRGKFLE